MRARHVSHARIEWAKKYFVNLDLGKDNEQRKQHQRLDQRQTQDHHRLNTSCSSGIASGSFNCRCSDSRLAKRATEDRDCKPDTRSNGLQTDAIVRRWRLVSSKYRKSGQQHCEQRKEKYVDSSHSLFLPPKLDLRINGLV